MYEILEGHGRVQSRPSSIMISSNEDPILTQCEMYEVEDGDSQYQPS